MACRDGRVISPISGWGSGAQTQTLSLHPTPENPPRGAMHGEYQCYITFRCLTAGILQELLC